MTHLSSRLDDLRAALGLAAARRGLENTPEWQAVDRALSLTNTDGDALPEAGSAEQDPLADVTEVFELSHDESNLLLVAVAPDLTPALGLAYGLLNGSRSPQSATVGLALELAGLPLLSGSARALLSAASPLRRWGVVTLGDERPALSRTLNVGEDVLGALLGVPTADPFLMAMERPQAGASTGLTHSESAATLAAAINHGSELVWLEESLGSAGLATAEAGCRRAGIRYHIYDLAYRPMDFPLSELVSTLIRRAALGKGALVLTGAELLASEVAVAQAIHHFWTAPIPVILVGRSRWHPDWHPELPLVIEAAKPTPADRLETWREQISAEDLPDAMLLPYRILPAQIGSVARHVQRRVAILGDQPGPELLADSVRMIDTSTTRSGSVARRTRTSFADLALPSETLAELRRFSDWVANRDEVLRRGRAHGVGKAAGIAALFAGSPGTGKTLAARVVADTAGLELMQVDLSAVVDKYIGETEKNLQRIFDEAEKLNVLLFFDEADALFGKRSEVRDARDRYANQEISFLLQRIEQFDGVTLLASNLRGNMDAAFARRLQFIITFPDPDVTTRRQLWVTLLEQAGRQDPDDPIDVGALAEKVELVGGDIRNIVLGATYDAVIQASNIGHRHVLAAAVREYAKLGRRQPVGLLS